MTEEEDIRAAVEALGSLKRSSTTSSQMSRSTSFTAFEDASSLYSPSTSLASVQDKEHLIDKLQQIPLVNNALKAYEIGKNSSRVVKYGTDLVEHSVQATLGRMPYMNQLDEFAVRQLNRFSPPTPQLQQPLDPQMMEYFPNQPMAASTSSPQQSQTQAQRSTWQSVLVEAGGMTAAISEESMRSLRFCLVLLSSATASLQTQIQALRNFILSLSYDQANRQKFLTAPPDLDNVRKQEQVLHSFKSEIIMTVKKSVDVISTYAGAALPEPAKKVVKDSILSLPMNLARTVGSRNHSSMNDSEDGMTVLQEASERVLTFAVEGLDVLFYVAGIFGETVERAEAWLNRLKVLRITNGPADPTPASNASATDGKQSTITADANLTPTLDAHTGAKGLLEEREGDAMDTS